MELRNNEIYLTQKEQKALDVAVNPLPAHELEGGRGGKRWTRRKDKYGRYGDNARQPFRGWLVWAVL
jgi:hypothetical protein